MAVQTFAALFLAHVIADYLLQWTWLVENKRRPVALFTHVGIVLAVMPLTTGMVSGWFLALAAAHLAIDALKTYVMPGGPGAYVADQVLHLVSILAVAALVPDLWAASPLAGIGWLPAAYLVTAALIFAARGGQFAVLAARGPGAGAAGVRIGWAERAAMSLAAAAAGGLGAVLGAVAVAAVKVAATGRLAQGRDAAGRRSLRLGTAISLGWGLVTALGLALALALLA